MRTSKFDLLRRCIDTRNLAGREAFSYSFGEYAASTANIQPAQTPGQI